MKTSTDIEKAMAAVLNFASLEQKERLHGALEAVLKYSPGQARDDHGRFATGGGGGVGGMSPDTGGGGGISGGSSPRSGGVGKKLDRKQTRSVIEGVFAGSSIKLDSSDNATQPQMNQHARIDTVLANSGYKKIQQRPPPPKREDGGVDVHRNGNIDLHVTKYVSRGLKATEYVDFEVFDNGM